MAVASSIRSLRGRDNGASAAEERPRTQKRLSSSRPRVCTPRPEAGLRWTRMRATAPRSFGAHLKALREVAGFTQEELATIAGLSVHAISALERGERRRPQLETVRALSAALDLPEAARDDFRRLARPAARISTPKGSGGAPLPLVLTSLVGREADLHTNLRQQAEP